MERERNIIFSGQNIYYVGIGLAYIAHPKLN